MKLRWTVRIAFLTGLTAFALLADKPARLHGALPACSPFLALMALAAGGASLILLPSVAFFVICFFKLRFFCRWICPVGTCFEMAGRGRGDGLGALGGRGSLRAENGQTVDAILRVPIAKLPRMGVWLLAVGLGAALVGYPLFLALDPLAIFASAFGWLRPELTLWEKAAACIFPAMVLLAAFTPWLWCGKLCPLGALQDVAAFPRRVHSQPKCSSRSMSDISAVRRTAATRNESPKDSSSSCSSRSMSDTMPFTRLRLRLRRGTVERLLQFKLLGFLKKIEFITVKHDTGRRIFLGLGLGVVYRLLLNPAKLHAGAAPMRPPLSGCEARFTRLCARCGACARACPDQIIVQDGEKNGFAGVLAPVLDFSRGGCPPDCTRCGEACPTGAIPVFTEQDKFDYPLGLAQLKKELCVLSHNRECGVCMNACPHRAIDIGWDAYEMTSVLKINTDLCTGCGICQYVCPERPAAIVVERHNT